MPPRVSTRPKVKIGISLDADLYDWLLERTHPGGEFASISHAVERCVVHYQRTHPPHGPGRGEPGTGQV